jgi:serine/threonine protein kinase
MDTSPPAGTLATDPPAPPGADDPVVGGVFDEKYLVTAELGCGGFGVVYEARDLALGATVAIKILRREVAEEEDLQIALQEEARRVTRIKHPHIVEWKAFAVTARGTRYFVMERLEGQSLETLLAREGALPAARVVPILLQILSALRAAHQAQADGPILHLDLKPSNVFLERDPDDARRDWVKVIDFGVGRFVGRAADGGSGAATAACGATIRTSTPADTHRVLSCTPNYAAPEHGAHLLSDVEAPVLDGRCDLYALGVIAFQMLTGRLPFAAEPEFEDLLRRKLVEDPPAVAAVQPGVPSRLAAFVDRCLRRRREDRFADAAQALRSLDRIARGNRWWLAAAVLPLSAASAWFAYAQTWSRAPWIALQLQTEAGPVPLTGESVHFGPARRAVALIPVGIAPPPSGATGAELAIRCLREPRRDAREVEWLQAAWAPDGRIELGAPRAAAAGRTLVYLAIARAAGTIAWSEPFEAVFLPDAPGRIEAAFVEGLRGRALDPGGQKLRVRLRLSPGDVQHVLVGDGARTVAAVPVPGEADGAIFEAELGSLDLGTGAGDVTVTLVDRAAARQSRTFRFAVAAGPLRFTDCTLVGTRVGDQVVLGPGDVAVLRVLLDGRADVTWSVVHENGTRLASGRIDDTTECERLLAGLPEDREYEGRVEVVAQDDRFVARIRPHERGTAVRSIAFVRTLAEPAVVLQVGTPGGTLRTLAEDAIAHVPSRRVPIGLTRANTVPVRVVLQRDGAAAEAAPLAEARLDTRAGAAWEGSLELEPGLHRLELLVWRVLPTGSLGPPAQRRRVALVVDVVPPALEAAVPADGLVFRSARAGLVLPVTTDDGAVAPAHSVRWQFRAAAGDATLAAGVVAENLGARATERFDLGWLQRFPDGPYVLQLTAQDAAGNAAQLAVPVVVAQTGPEVEPLLPDGTGQWTAEPSRLFPLELRARDPNGVKSVRCTFGDDAIGSVGVDLQPDGPASSATRWRGAVGGADWWDRADVPITIVATDVHGNASTVRLRQRVGSIVRFTPERLAVVHGGVALESMALVRGNHAGVYVFGGRGDDVEGQLFREAGLPPFNPFAIARSWQIEFPPGTVADFYLGEGEVTVAQYRRFVCAPDGYREARHWPAAAPSPHRLLELEGRTVAGGDLPMTGVSWDEAQAYAAWTGRRLCTFGEWEYAARGGLRYLPCAFAGAGGAPLAVEVNVGYGAGHGPWPMSRGADQVAGGLVRNLCSNVAEWTDTPVTSGGVRAGMAGLAFLQPASAAAHARAERFWLAGASWLDGSPGFPTADVRPRSWSGAHAGFRCAIGAEHVARMLQRARPDDFRFEAIR